MINIKDEDNSAGNYFTQEKPIEDFISSGSTLLNCVLGGGWPLGRVVNIVGDKSTGKSLLAIEATANFIRQFSGGHIFYHEAEAAFDKNYAAALGMPIESIHFVGEEEFYDDGLLLLKDDIETDTVEGLFEVLDTLTKHYKKYDKPGLYILDSLDAITDKAEKDREISAGSYTLNKQKKLSELFRRLVRNMSETRMCFIITSQVRDNIGVTFGKKHTRSGGKALDFYASLVLWLADTGKIKKTIRKIERPIGIKVKAKCEKNKISLPYRDCEFPILFGYGIDDITASLNWLKIVDGLSDLEIDASAIGRLSTKLREGGDPDLVQRIQNHTKKLWAKIETSFLPTTNKYR